MDSARDYGAEVISIARSDFDHGGTRTMLARQARGEILVFFTQDAILASRNALQLLVAPLQDGTAACSYGRQLPNINASPVAAHLAIIQLLPGIVATRV